MTAKQIKYVLSREAVKENEWLALENHFTIISITNTTMLYIDDRFYRYRFNSSTELLEVVEGTMVNGVFTSRLGETSNYTPTTYLTYAILYLFVRSSERKFMNCYYRRDFK